MGLAQSIVHYNNSRITTWDSFEMLEGCLESEPKVSYL